MSRRTIALAAVLSFLAWATFYALSFTVDLPTTHLDGAFQSASSVYRLNAGYFPGRDFMPYLGIGPTFVIFPAFRAAGADLAASEFSTHLMTLGFSWLSVSLLWHLIFRPHSFPASLAAGASSLALTVIATLTESRSSATPSTMLRRPATRCARSGRRRRRSRWPSMYWECRRLASAAGRATLFGFATGLILLWSNDFAIPSAALLGVLFAADAYGRRELGKIEAALYAVVAVGSWLALLTVSTAGHPLEFLRYNFIDVAQDQWWYFGPYDEASRVFGISELPSLILAPEQPAPGRPGDQRDRRGSNPQGGACLGLRNRPGPAAGRCPGLRGRAYRAIFRWFRPLGGGYGPLSLNAARDMAEHANAMKALARRLEGLALPIAVVLSVALTLLTVQRYRSAQNAAARDPGRFYVAELGGYLGSEWKDYIGLARRTGAQPAVEEYWGVWSATRRQFSSWPVNSVIHALGRTREIARTALGSAELVVTTRNSASPEWQSWSFSQNFWFYDQLLRGWEPQAMSPTTVLWRKSGAASVGSERRDRVPAGSDGLSIVLFPTAAGLYRVQMDYDLARAGRNLLLVRNNYFRHGRGGWFRLPGPRREAD